MKTIALKVLHAVVIAASQLAPMSLQAQLCPAGPHLSMIPCKPLQYNGGPFLESFTIYPLYLGQWNQTDIDTQQAFLTNFTAYLSGQNAPEGQQPVLKQYGVNQAAVASAATSLFQGTAASYKSKCGPTPPVPGTLYFCDVPEIIANNQAAHKLPSYGLHTLIVVFPAYGFQLDPSCPCAGYHSSVSTSGFYAIIPQGAGSVYPGNAFQAVTSHEVFEAATDPADGTTGCTTCTSFLGWDEAADQCDTEVTLNWPGGVTLEFAAIVDNTQHGACTTTGYTSLDEIQVYGWTYSEYRTKYNALWPEGWRLYSLQSYVLSTGAVLYNAVWRPTANTPEIQDYGVSFSKFKGDYDTLFPEGWRLYIFQAYVVKGDVLYNAVWRPGTVAETQIYGVSYAQFRSQYDTLYPEGWRLYVLQSYVMPNGDVLYNAVWRPGNTGETQVYGWTYADYRAKYNELFPQGWRLYILDSYAISDGTVRYNAVWRPATHAETQVYDWTYPDYRTEYNTLFPEGWRLYILNASVLPGDSVRYDAVWRHGAIDRPL